MSLISPADQIMIAVTHVHQAHGGDPPARAVAAAVLAAAADQVVPQRCFVPDFEKTLEGLIRTELLAIADELKAP